MMTNGTTATAGAPPLPARQPDEIAALLRDAMKRSPGARMLFLERAGLGLEALAVAAEALAALAVMQERAAAARGVVDDAVKSLIWFSEEKEIGDVADDLGEALELLAGDR
jgi:hypothetical protein